MLPISDTRLREALTTALSVQRWVDEVAAASPFASVAQLLRIAEDAAVPLSGSEIDEALAHHPRIGDRPVGEGAAQSFSRAEQSSADSGDEALAAALATGNAEYENRFGRVFLIRAAGRSRAEILGELRRRMHNDAETESEIIAAQLREIAILRLSALLGDPAESS